MNTLVIINIIVTDQKSEQRINDKPLRLFVYDKLTVAYPAVFTCCPSRLVFELLHLNLHLHLPIIVLPKRFDKLLLVMVLCLSLLYVVGLPCLVKYCSY